jgi:hypothetical protein
MSTPQILSLPRSRAAAAGTWRLHPGHSMSLRPRRASVLRVDRGRVWVTLGGPYQGSTRASGDVVLCAGETLPVPAGARVVMEPWPQAGDALPVHFDWQERPAPACAGRFACEVLAPSRQLRTALGEAALASVRLLRGLLTYGGGLLSGRLHAWGA